MPSTSVKYSTRILEADALINKQQLDRTEPKITANLGPNVLITTLASGPKIQQINSATMKLVEVLIVYLM